MNSLFCRHNRFTADCPICSKGTVLDPGAASRQRAPKRGAAPQRGSSAAQAGAARYTGPYASAGPYEDGEGERYEVRLERVPGGVRLGEWAAGQLRRRAPVLGAGDVGRLVADAREREVLREPDAAALWAALGSESEAAGGSGEPPFGASPGRSGDMREELRVERLGAELLRIGRWVLRPGADWELRQAPTMLPAKRYAEALASAARRGVLAASAA